MSKIDTTSVRHAIDNPKKGTTTNKWFKRGLGFVRTIGEFITVCFTNIKTLLFNNSVSKYTVFASQQAEMKSSAKVAEKAATNVTKLTSSIEEQKVNIDELIESIKTLKNQSLTKDEYRLAMNDLQKKLNAARYNLSRDRKYLDRLIVRAKIAEQRAIEAKEKYETLHTALLKFVKTRLNNIEGYTNIQMPNLETAMVYLYHSAVYQKAVFNNMPDEQYRHVFMVAYRLCIAIINTSDVDVREQLFSALKSYIDETKTLESSTGSQFFDIINSGHSSALVYAEYLKLLIELMHNSASALGYTNEHFDTVCINKSMAPALKFYKDNIEQEITNRIDNKTTIDVGAKRALDNQLLNMINDMFKKNNTQLNNATDLTLNPAYNINTKCNEVEYLVRDILLTKTTVKNKTVWVLSELALNTQMYLDDVTTNLVVDQTAKRPNVIVSDNIKTHKQTVTAGANMLAKSIFTIYDMLRGDAPESTIEDGKEVLHPWNRKNVGNLFTIDVQMGDSWVPENTEKVDYGRFDAQKMAAIRTGVITFCKSQINDPENFLNNRNFIMTMKLTDDGVKFIETLYHNFKNDAIIMNHEQEMAMWFIIRNYYPMLKGLVSLKVLEKNIENCKANINYNNAGTVLGDSDVYDLYMLVYGFSGLNITYKNNDIMANPTKKHPAINNVTEKLMHEYAQKALTFDSSRDVSGMIRRATVIVDEKVVQKSIDGASILFTNKIGSMNPKAVKFAGAEGASNFKAVSYVFDMSYELRMWMNDKSTKTTIMSRLLAIFGTEEKANYVLNIINKHDFHSTDLIICNSTAIKNKDGIHYGKEWTLYVTDSYHKVEYEFNANKGLIGYLAQHVLQVVYKYITMSNTGRITVKCAVKCIMAIPHFIESEEMKNTVIVSPKTWSRMVANLKNQYKGIYDGVQINPEDLRLILVAYPMSCRTRFMKVIVSEHITCDVLFPSHRMNDVARDFDGDNMSFIVAFNHGIKTDADGFTMGETLFSNNPELHNIIDEAIVARSIEIKQDVNRKIKMFYDDYRVEARAIGINLPELQMNEQGMYKFPDEFLNNSVKLAKYVMSEVSARVMTLHKTPVAYNQYVSNKCRIYSGFDFDKLNTDQMNMVIGSIAHEMLLSTAVIANFNYIGQLINELLFIKVGFDNETKSDIYSGLKPQFKKFENADLYYGNHINFADANEKLIKGEKKRVKYEDILTAIEVMNVKTVDRIEKKSKSKDDSESEQSEHAVL